MSHLPLGNSAEALLLVRDKNSFIQWPMEQEIQEVSTRLARIAQVGIRSEADGDYFKSGDLASQIQEIIRSLGRTTQEVPTSQSLESGQGPDVRSKRRFFP